MTLEELRKIFPDATEEQLEALSKGFSTSPTTPPTPPSPPTPPQKEVKADTQITMTAAEFMQLMSSLDKSKKLDEIEKNKEKTNDDRIFI